MSRYYNFRTALLHCLVVCLIWMTAAATISAQQTHATVSGRITTPTGAPCGNALVIVNGTASGVALTNANGFYSLSLPVNGTYQIAPFCNTNPINGVSTLDVALIWRHLNGTELLNTPYKIIAADADNDALLTMADTLFMRNVILGFTPAFPGGSSFRFVPKNHVFADPLNPFPYPQALTIGNLTGNVTGQDFYAIKIGDINNTAITTDLGVSTGSPTFPSYIEGQLTFDQNNNCLQDSSELPLEGWKVLATSTVGAYYGVAQTGGHYRVYAPAGTYNVSLLPPNNLWEICQNNISVSLGAINTVNLDFTAWSPVSCPRMQADISTPFLRRCFDNYYDVNWCNTGTALAENASLEVTLDTFLTVLSSSIPWSSQNGQTFHFQLGNVQAGACGTLRLFFNLSCDAALGQTHCSEVHIFPDSICGPQAWNGPRLEINGRCENGSAIFTVINTGNPMTQTAEYVVLEDVIIQMTGSNIQLGAQQSQTITLPANGSTWRLEVDQAPGYPGFPIVSAALEGCGTRPDGSFSTGILAQFPAYTPSEAIDVDCQANRGAFDPNDKQGFPQGVGTAHHIPKNTPIDYQIRFQNTGTDTAFFIKILDTLSAAFDVKTLRVRGASHPFSYQILANNVLQFVFPNIMLPDSNVNERASHGYVRFTIAPLSDLPNETLVSNQAGIYFDFNPPIITNRTWHTIGEQYLKISNVSFVRGLDLDVFPNPSHSTAVFYLKTADILQGQLYLYDAQGRLQLRQPFGANLFDVNVSTLGAGLYYFRLVSDNGQLLATGKLAVQRV